MEIDNPQEALAKMLLIKSVIKAINVNKSRKDKTKGKKEKIDVRVAIGLAEKTYIGKKVTENNGPAYIYANEKLSNIKKEKRTLALKSDCISFDREFNLILWLIDAIIDRWGKHSGELLEVALTNPNMTQMEIGELIGVKQSAVSGRWNRSNINEILAVEKYFRKRVVQLL